MAAKLGTPDYVLSEQAKAIIIREQHRQLNQEIHKKDPAIWLLRLLPHKVGIEELLTLNEVTYTILTIYPNDNLKKSRRVYVWRTITSYYWETLTQKIITIFRRK